MEAFDLEKMYAKHRKCLIKKNGEVKELAEANRMTLGYEKAQLLVSCANVTSSQNVMNVFSGASGIIRLLSLYSPKLLVGLDILCEGISPTPTGWCYASKEAFSFWRNDLKKYNKSVKEPLFIQQDVKKPEHAFSGSFDNIIIDPPYGDISYLILGHTVDEAKDIYLEAVLMSLDYLADNGKITTIIPEEWFLSTKELCKSSEVKVIVSLGGKHNLVVASIKEKRGYEL